MGILGGNVMAGMIFYWVSWFFWVVATFFMNRESKERMKVSIHLLAVMILAQSKATVAAFNIHLSSLYLFIVVFIEIAKKKQGAKLYILLASFIVMLAYASFLLFELYDPVMVMFSRNLMVAGIVCFICVLLQAGKIERFYILIIGMLQGEFLFAMILNEIGFSYPIGGERFLDALSSASFSLFFWNLCEWLFYFIEQNLNREIRGKQKST
jgi:hypothetical protein